MAIFKRWSGNDIEKKYLETPYEHYELHNVEKYCQPIHFEKRLSVDELCKIMKQKLWERE